MIENYTNAATKYSAQQQQLPLMQEQEPEQAQVVAPAQSVTPIDDVFNSIFNKSSLIFILWFLGIYFVAYFGLGFIFNKDADVSTFQIRLSRILDIIFLVILLLFLWSFYFSNSTQQQLSTVNELSSNVGDFLENPVSIFSTIFFLLLFYLTTYLFRIPMTYETKPLFVSFIENIAWIVLIIIIFIDFFKYFLGIPIVGLFNIWNTVPNYYHVVTDNSNNIVKRNAVTDNSGNGVGDNSGNVVTPKRKDEVFNISNNLYTYDDAQAICSAYDAKLATYDQIEDAYKNGAEWCNYGWSDNQSIYFPTQKDTWSYLQGTKKHKNDCGRPGINGGFIANPYAKFGVNCFGKKPTETDEDLARLAAKQHNIYPKTPEDVELDAKVKYWKDNAAQLLQLNSFNTKAWSEY